MGRHRERIFKGGIHPKQRAATLGLEIDGGRLMTGNVHPEIIGRIVELLKVGPSGMIPIRINIFSELTVGLLREICGAKSVCGGFSGWNC